MFVQQAKKQDMPVMHLPVQEDGFRSLGLRVISFTNYIQIGVYIGYICFYFVMKKKTGISQKIIHKRYRSKERAFKKKDHIKSGGPLSIPTLPVSSNFALAKLTLTLASSQPLTSSSVNPSVSLGIHTILCGREAAG